MNYGSYYSYFVIRYSRFNPLFMGHVVFGGRICPEALKRDWLTACSALAECAVCDALKRAIDRKKPCLKTAFCRKAVLVLLYFVRFFLLGRMRAAFARLKLWELGIPFTCHTRMRARNGFEVCYEPVAFFLQGLFQFCENHWLHRCPLYHGLNERQRDG